MPVPIDLEGRRLVVPGDLVEVEQLRELALAVVSETDSLVRKGGGRRGFLCAAPLGQLPLLYSNSACLARIFDRAFEGPQFA